MPFTMKIKYKIFFEAILLGETKYIHPVSHEFNTEEEAIIGISNLLSRPSNTNMVYYILKSYSN